MDMDVGRVGAAYASFFQGGRAAGEIREEDNRSAPGAPPYLLPGARGADGPGAERREGEAAAPREAAGSQTLLSRLVQRHPREVRLQVHEATNRVIIRINDAQTGETLAEVPRESYLDMVASFLSRLDRFQEEARGVNLDRVF